MQMRSSTYRLFAYLAVVALAGLPMVAAADEWDACVKLSDDLAVAGCSRAIDSHQYTGRSLARLYARRGGAYQAQGDLDRAMPVQAPTKYELIVNLKAAKAIGLTVPASVLARADEVIE